MDDDVNALTDKLRNKHDLYVYLTERCKFMLNNTSAGNIWLPAEKYCRMLFLQQILEETKKSLIADEVRVNERIRGWLPEYACANVWPLVRTDANLRKYLPAEDMDLGRWPDRRFFWGIVNTFHPEWVTSYLDDAIKQRDKMQIINRTKLKTINVSATWKQRLLAHDFTPKGKGKYRIVIDIVAKKGRQSIIIKRDFQV